MASRRDWAAVSAVLVGAIAHYWLLRDVFGDHPSGVDEARYLAAFVERAAGWFEAGGQDGPSAQEERP